MSASKSEKKRLDMTNQNVIFNLVTFTDNLAVSDNFRKSRDSGKCWRRTVL